MSDIVERLAPCPFCGGEAELDNAAEPQFARRPTVTCKNENCFGYMPSAYYARDAEAIAAWNRRSDATLTALREEVERLTREVEHYNKNGIVEISVRNVSVADYMAHWEGRTERAEAELIALRQRVKEVLEPFAKYETPEAGNGLFQLPDECDVLFNGTGEDCAAVITLGHFRAARALINEIKETK